ncbi:ExbD/TolR family protein [Sandaracinobacteroides saxicola]|uniref:Biopolymer transporter ExbD n=1 Tax=Sandaracinobacteroides saxicola TaxID=2759707 RepID=A0A7G5IL54_9SPHN|nr:biopolymer transporter ExbD [Sandaracinobacteroides saxicola]QMW24096.1 biopolymer transporter ExbD [Sandaracinobacteroides saxicola]
MAMALGNRVDDSPIGDMNTTPLIDVMLVLLIMFIITIPVQTHSVKLDLPSDGNTIRSDFNQVNIDFLNAIYWNNQEVTLEQLRSYLDTISRMPLDDQPELRLKPEPMSKYDVAVKVMAQAQQAGITKMGFVGNEAYL